MIAGRALMIALACLAPVMLSGCLGVATTQRKSAAKAKLVRKHLHQSGLKITTANAQVKVRSTAVLQDANGAAAVVLLRNSGGQQARVPLAFAVQDAQGKRLYANDAPGLDPSLTSVALLARGQELYWVDDQVLVTGRPAKVTARIGAAKAPVPAEVPRISLSGVEVHSEPDGMFARGVVRNESGVVQKRLTISCVALRDGRVRAAGRAVVDRLEPAARAKKPTQFTAFFIGNPKGARVQCAAPPTVLTGGTTP